MKPETKKWIIVGALSVISVALGAAYLQYRRIMQYVIKARDVKFNAINLSVVDFNITLGFFNKSDLKFIIVGQSHSIYVNDIFVTTIESKKPTEILPKQESLINLNVKFSPQDIADKIKLSNILLAPDKVKIKVDVKLSFTFWGFPINIPYVYETTIKELLTKKEPQVK